MKTLIIAIVAVLIVAAGVYAYRTTTAPSNGGEASQVVCTMEAKLCPDGSYVGRTGPYCEFAACPSSIVTGSTVSTTTNGNGHSTTTSTTTKTVQIKY